MFHWELPKQCPRCGAPLEPILGEQRGVLAIIFIQCTQRCLWTEKTWVIGLPGTKLTSVRGTR